MKPRNYREPKLNDLILREIREPYEDSEVTLKRSSLNSMLRTAMRRGAELVAIQAKKYRIELSDFEAGNHVDAVRYEAIRKFVEE